MLGLASHVLEVTYVQYGLSGRLTANIVKMTKIGVVDMIDVMMSIVIVSIVLSCLSRCLSVYIARRDCRGDGVVMLGEDPSFGSLVEGVDESHCYLREIDNVNVVDDQWETEAE